MVPLPFKCHMLGAAACADAEISGPTKKEGEHEVIFPVGLPEQGYFDWVDHFLEMHPDFMELSDRKILEWCVESGLARPYQGQSNDKPELRFGVWALDDGAVQRLVHSIAPSARRNFILPQLAHNLVSVNRKRALLSFASQGYKKTAMVVTGEPTDDYKEFVQKKIVSEKINKIREEKAKERR